MRRFLPSLRSIVSLLFCTIVFLVLWRGGKSLDSVWIMGGVASLLAAHGLLHRRVVCSTITQRIAIGALGVFVVWTCLSFFFSSTRTYGFDEVLQMLSLSLIFLWTLRTPFDTRRFTLAFARTLSIAVLIAAAAGVLVYLYQPVTRFVGTFFDARFHTDYWPNAWAEYVLLAWPMLLMVLLKTRTGNFLRCRRHDLLRATVLGVTFGTLLLSYSRGAFLAFSGQAVLLLFLWGWSQRGRIPLRSLLLGASVVAGVGLVLFGVTNELRSSRFPLESVWQKATFTASEGASSVSERGQFFRQSWSLALERPLVGWGPYSFRFVQPHIQTGVLATSDHPHNVFLKLAMERGLIAAAAFLLLLLCAVFAGLRTIAEQARRGIDDFPIEPFLLTALLGVIAHCLIDYNLQFVGIALPLWMMMGLLLRADGPERGEWRIGRWLHAGLTLVLVFLLLFEGVHLVNSSFARRADARGETAEALRIYARTDTSFFSRDGWLARSILSLSTHQYPAAENAILISLAENAEDARSWRILGDVYLAWGQREDALRAYDKAFTFGRWNDAGIAAGLALLLTEDRSLLGERRVDLDVTLQAFVTAIEHNAHFIALGQNVEDTALLARRMAALFPVDARRYRALALDVEAAAARERERFSARPRGLLW